MTEMRTLVLTADPATGALDTSAAEIAKRFVKGRARWLAPGAALEVSNAEEGTRKLVEQALSGRAIDVNLVPSDTALRCRKLLVADLESTIIEQELIDELAQVAGCREEIAVITSATMRGEIDFAQSIQERVARLAGLTTRDLEAVADRISLMPGAASLIRGMKRSGAATALVSGGFSHFVERVARQLDFDTWRGNTLEIKCGRLTGRLVPPLLDSAMKRSILFELVASHGLTPSEAVAVGDGANDLAMLEAAGLAVAFRAKPKVRLAARALPTGAVIDCADLTALLHLQGLPLPPN